MAPAREIVLTLSNIEQFPSFKRLLDDGKVVADKTGRLRYPHGAPVGMLILVGVNKDGTPKYKESAEGWFDPDGPRAREFKWPE